LKAAIDAQRTERVLNQPTDMTLALPRETAEPEAVRHAYRGLVAMGWTTAQAGNLAAHLAGLEITRKDWAIAEVEGLMFIRSLVLDGRLEP
jgi:hypothetical protein